MRTSNKILLTVFVALLLMLTSIYGAIYVKYTNGNFITSAKIHEERYDVYPVTGVQSVSITGLERVTIIPSDTARLEVEKQVDEKPLHVFDKGVLTLAGQKIVNNSDGTTAIERNYRDVLIYLPYNQIINADNCNLTLNGTTDTMKNLSVQLSLKETNLMLGTTVPMNDKGIGNFSSVNISQATGGNINIVTGAVIKRIEAKLDASRFSDGGASVDSLILAADKSSTISITGNNIPNTSFISKP